MNKPRKAIFFDNDLGIEIARFENVLDKNFLRYFNDKYTIGLLEQGNHFVIYNDAKYLMSEEDTITLNPRETYSFSTENTYKPISYLSISISPTVLRKIIKEYEISNIVNPPYFQFPVILNDEKVKKYIRNLFSAIEQGKEKAEKERIFYTLISYIIKKYTISSNKIKKVKYCEEIELVCNYIDENFATISSLDDFVSTVNPDMNVAEFVDVFTIAKRITPYRYLENARIDNAKKLLEKGYSTTEASEMSGFTARMYFSKVFSANVGITPYAYRLTAKKIK